MNTQTLTQRRARLALAQYAANTSQRGPFSIVELSSMRAMTEDELTAMHIRNAPLMQNANQFLSQPEPVQMCAVVEDSDPPLVMMLVWTVLTIPAWALFGWAVVTVIRLVGGAV